MTGNIFEETGDRLTPSHGQTRNGIRHRYHVLHRLIARSGERDVSGWRLNAQMLEELTARVAVRHLDAAAFAAAAIIHATADELITAHGRAIDRISAAVGQGARARSVADLITRTDLAPGQIGIAFDPVAISDLLRVAGDRINPDLLRITACVTMRRRGVETRLVRGSVAQPPGRTLIANIATALGWPDGIRAGKTRAEIAGKDGVPTCRFRQAVCCAFLAPGNIRQVQQGRQPVGLSPTRIFRNPLPRNWGNTAR